MTWLLFFFFGFGLVSWGLATIEALRWWLRIRRMRITFADDWEKAQNHLKYLFALSRATAERFDERARGPVN